MEENNFDAFDRAIEEALASEPLKPVPFGFRRTVDKRVRLARLVQRERRHFRKCLVMASVVFVGLTGLLGGAALIGNWPGAILGSIPGAMGMLDFAVARFTPWGPGLAGVAVLLAAASGIGGVALELVRVRRVSIG